MTLRYKIIDATLASYEAAAQTMRRLLDKKIQVALVFIGRPKEDAWENAYKNVLNMVHTKPHALSLI